MKSRNLFWGLFFVAGAGLVIANGLGYLTGITLFNLIIVFFMIPIILKSIIHINFFGIFFPLAILAILFANTLGISNFVPFPVLAVALFLSIGFSLIFGRHSKYMEKWHNIRIHNEHFDRVVNTEDEDVVNFGVTLGSSIKYVNSKKLKQANLSCSFGALIVYFDNTTISEEGAEISIDVSFSGVELYMPREWRVINEIESVFSGIEEKHKKDREETANVKLTGKASFSGIEIIYV
jgi:predicted membrane protein